VERRKQLGRRPTLVIVSDGEANLPLVPGTEVFPVRIALARDIRKEGISSLIIDS